jgi:hypothetical protein
LGFAGSFFSDGALDDSGFAEPATLSIISSITTATYSPSALSFGVIFLTVAARFFDIVVGFLKTGDYFENRRGDLFLGIKVDIALSR